MNNSDFEREMLLRLRESLQRYPETESGDVVKFIFQGMLGPGHLLADRATVLSRIEKEMSSLSADPDEPLTEPLSPAWERLNLRRAMAEHISAGQIADLMMQSKAVPFTRQDVYGLCRRIAADGDCPLSPESLEQILRTDWLPSHSDAYRSCYHPAYRVIPRQSAGVSLDGRSSRCAGTL